MLKRVVLIAAAVLLFAPTAALADGIDFGFTGGSATATMTTVSGSSNLTVVARIPSPPGAIYSVNGTVNFTSGAWNSGALNNQGGYDPGGSLSITYGGSGLTGSGLTSGAQLVSGGTFTSTQTWSITSMFGCGPSTCATIVFQGAISGNVNPLLYAFLGLPNVNPAQGFMITLLITFNFANCTATSCTGSISSGNIILTPIPEPGTLALFGTGLVGLAGMIRRRMSK